MQLLIPAATSGVGYLIGGGTGAQIGWMLGSMFSAEEQTINTSKVGETFIATSAYGVPLAKVYGTDVVSGNTFWASEKVPHTQEVSSGGGKGFGGGQTSVEQTYYTCSRAISIAQGPILGIRRVWNNEKLVVEAGGNPLPGTLHLGTNTQGRDSYLQQVLGADVPAWRGWAYMVLENEYLGVSGVLPNYRFEVVYGEPL